MSRKKILARASAPAYAHARAREGAIIGAMQDADEVIEIAERSAKVARAVKCRFPDAMRSRFSDGHRRVWCSRFDPSLVEGVEFYVMRGLGGQTAFACPYTEIDFDGEPIRVYFYPAIERVPLMADVLWDQLQRVEASGKRAVRDLLRIAIAEYYGR